MRTIITCNLASALLLGVLTFGGIAIAADENSKLPPSAHDKAAVGHAIPAKPGKVPSGPKKLGPIKYECKMDQCTCSTPADCGVMGGDHVCTDGTFKGDSKTGGGTCTLKKSP